MTMAFQKYIEPCFQVSVALTRDRKMRREARATGDAADGLMHRPMSRKQAKYFLALAASSNIKT